MVDVDTFLTTLYVMIDGFCSASLPTEVHPGPHAALSRSEVLTLAISLCAAPPAPGLSWFAHTGAI